MAGQRYEGPERACLAAHTLKGERWYRIPRALPVGRCYFFERYDFQ